MNSQVGPVLSLNCWGTIPPDPHNLVLSLSSLTEMSETKGVWVDLGPAGNTCVMTFEFVFHSVSHNPGAFPGMC